MKIQMACWSALASILCLGAESRACTVELQFKTKAICQANYSQVKAAAEKVNAVYATTKSVALEPANLIISECSRYLTCWNTCGYVSVEIVDALVNGQTHKAGSGCAALLNEMNAKGYGDKIVEPPKEALSIPQKGLPKDIRPRHSENGDEKAL